MRVELTAPLPFADASFDRIFSEHVLEHFTRDAGLSLLRECRRVIVPDGRIRITVPDLDFYLSLFNDPATWPADTRAFATFITETHKLYTPCQILNWQLTLAADHPYGHKFAYNESELRAALIAAGFGDVRRYKAGESDDPELRGLENVERLPPRIIATEALTLEASPSR